MIKKIRETLKNKSVLHLCGTKDREVHDTEHVLPLLCGDPGVVFYSSGSTGQSKACLHNLRIMWERYEGVARKYKSAVLTFPPTHIGGFNTVLAYGDDLYYPPDVSPMTVFRIIEEHKIEVLPTSPSFLNLALLQGAEKEYDLSSLKLITFGSEPMPDSLLSRLRRVFPEVKFKQTYGLSETGIFSTQSSGNYIRMKDPIKIRDGLLWVKKPPSMIGYLNYPNVAGEYFPTKDVVKQRADGWIRILSRNEEIISVGGKKVYPAEVEEVILSVPGVRDCAVKGEKNLILGEIVTAVIEGNFSDAALWEACERLPKYKRPLRVHRGIIQYQNSKKIRNSIPA